MCVVEYSRLIQNITYCETFFFFPFFFPLLGNPSRGPALLRHTSTFSRKRDSFKDARVTIGHARTVIYKESKDQSRSVSYSSRVVYNICLSRPCARFIIRYLSRARNVLPATVTAPLIRELSTFSALCVSAVFFAILHPRVNDQSFNTRVVC